MYPCHAVLRLDVRCTCDVLFGHFRLVAGQTPMVIVRWPGLSGSFFLMSPSVILIAHPFLTSRLSIIRKFLGDRYRPIIDRYMFLFGHKAKTNRCPTGMHQCMIDVHDRSNWHWPDYLRAWVSVGNLSKMARNTLQVHRNVTRVSGLFGGRGLLLEESLKPASISTDTLIFAHWPTNATRPQHRISFCYKFCEIVPCGHVQYAAFIWSLYMLTYEYLDHSTCIF